jgi:hypothetical protein
VEERFLPQGHGAPPDPLSEEPEEPCGGLGPARGDPDIWLKLLITPFYGTCGDAGLAQKTCPSWSKATYGASQL